MLSRLVGSFAISLALPLAALAQAPPAAPAKPDSPEVQALVEKTKKAGGTQFAQAAHFWCEAPRANAATDPAIPPTKIFDNVYAIGSAAATTKLRARVDSDIGRPPGARPRERPS